MASPLLSCCVHLLLSAKFPACKDSLFRSPRLPYPHPNFVASASTLSVNVGRGSQDLNTAMAAITGGPSTCSPSQETCPCSTAPAPLPSTSLPSPWAGPCELLLTGWAWWVSPCLCTHRCVSHRAAAECALSVMCAVVPPQVFTPGLHACTVEGRGGWCGGGVWGPCAFSGV